MTVITIVVISPIWKCIYKVSSSPAPLYLEIIQDPLHNSQSWLVISEETRYSHLIVLIKKKKKKRRIEGYANCKIFTAVICSHIKRHFRRSDTGGYSPGTFSWGFVSQMTHKMRGFGRILIITGRDNL